MALVACGKERQHAGPAKSFLHGWHGRQDDEALRSLEGSASEQHERADAVEIDRLHLRQVERSGPAPAWCCDRIFIIDVRDGRSSPTMTESSPTRGPRRFHTLVHHAAVSSFGAYCPSMTYYVFNYSGGDREAAAALLRAKMFGVAPDERHRDDLAAGDVALIYVATEKVFVGCAELATPVHDWTASEADAYPGDSPSGVVLRHVDEWDPVVPMETVVRRIDPTASNPLVQQNAATGFPMGVVWITEDEYEAAVDLSHDRRAK